MVTQSLEWVVALFAIATGGWGSTAPEPGEVVPLEVSRVLPIEAPFAVEPSGLCLREGRLYSVSDDTDAIIFEVIVEDEIARFVPALEFRAPEGTRGGLDLEGIAVGPEGSFYLASERFARVLQVFPDGRSDWAGPSGLTDGKEAGLFKNRGGQVEGMARLGDGSFLLAAERQPRGLLHYVPETGFKGQPMPATRYAAELALLRPPDFTGLDYFDDTVWVLHRNAALVGTLAQEAGVWAEGPIAWSFQEIVNDPAYHYCDQRFGLAEGLAVDDRYFYVVLDNNGDRRATDSRDRRPLLLILDRPGKGAGSKGE